MKLLYYKVLMVSPKLFPLLKQINMIKWVASDFSGFWVESLISQLFSPLN
jgi:hypothetical protein